MTRFLLALALVGCSPDDSKQRHPVTTTPTTGSTTPTGTTTPTPPLTAIAPTRAVLLDTRTNDPEVIAFAADVAWESLVGDVVDLGFVDCTPPSDDQPTYDAPLDRNEAALAPYLAEPSASWGGEQGFLDSLAQAVPVVPTVVGNDCDALAIADQVQTAADGVRALVDARMVSLEQCVEGAGIAWCEAQAALDDPFLPVVAYCEDYGLDPADDSDTLMEDVPMMDSWCYRCRGALDRAEQMARKIDLQIARCERSVDALYGLRDLVWYRAELGLCMDDDDIDGWTDDAALLLQRTGAGLDRVEAQVGGALSGLDACKADGLQLACDSCDHSLAWQDPGPGWIQGTEASRAHAERLADALDAAAEETDAPPTTDDWPALATELRELGASDILHIVVPVDGPQESALVVVGDGRMGLPRMVVIHRLPGAVEVTEAHTELVADGRAWSRALEVIGSYGNPDGGNDTGRP